MKHKDNALLESPVIESPHILLVEDQQIAQLGIAMNLESWGCTVTTASTGAEAVEKTTAAFYDLIYLDVHLPDMTGIKVATRIRENTENFNRYTPIIGITATASEKTIANCLDNGFNGVYLKPLSKDTHVQICESHLGIPLACVDMNLTRQLAANNEVLAKDMLQMLYTSLQQDIPEIKKAFAANDGERFYFLLQRIYGGILHVGTPELQISCKKLEQAYREQAKDILPCFASFIRATDRFQNYYTNQISY